jgi:putative DNA primase/helicase
MDKIDIEIEGMDFLDDVYLNSDNIDNEFGIKLLDSALHYAKCGYPVIALHNLENNYGTKQCSCKAVNCPYPGKHPRTYNGSKGATTDENKIIDWWDKNPNSNIGLLTGKESGFFVLDIDTRLDAEVPYNGEEVLIALTELYRDELSDEYFMPIPETLTAISGSGSRHLYFRYNLDLIIPNSKSKIGRKYGMGLDIKSDNGYIIAPPSNHKSGNRYKWVNENTPILDAPDWLHYEIQKAATVTAKKPIASVSSGSQKEHGKKIPVGERNEFIHKYICGLVNTYPKDEVFRRAVKASQEKFTQPLTDAEILRTLNWAWNKFRKPKGNNLGIKK